MTDDLKERNASRKKGMNYVYLDWNAFRVFFDLDDKYESQGINLKEVIRKVKNKYKIPYSKAHMLDRCHNFREEYRSNVEEDFLKMNVLTDSLCLFRDSNDAFGLIYKDVKACFDETLLKTRENKM